MAYYSFLYNTKIAEIYSSWRQNDPPQIPKKFQPKPIPGEKEEQRQARIILAKDQMKSEIQIMKIKADSYQKTFESIDNQMVKNIEEKLSDIQDAIEKAKLSWQEACSKEMNFSQEIWKKREA